MARDHQRERLYAAEKLFFTTTAPDIGLPRPSLRVESGYHKGALVDFTTLDECQDYVEQLQGSDHYRRARGHKRLRLHSGAGNRHATYCEQSKEIKLPLWARSRWVIAHELAHHLTHRTPRALPAHGASFCRHFIELVRVGLGDAYAIGLESQFVKADLDVRPLADMKLKKL